jgi:DNA-binding PadR family transcriptional regulator
LVMARANSSDLPGGMVTLGLVIDMPDQTAKYIGHQLSRRFHRSHFSRSTGHSAIVRLHQQGCIRRTHKAPGRERTGDRYVATPLGERVFRDWMYDLPSRDGSGPDLALREAMYGRIELCKVEDIPRLLELAREEVTVSTALFNEASKRLTEQEAAARRLKELRPDSKKRPTERVREILGLVEPLHWSHRAERYELIVKELEEIIDEMQDAVSES